LPPELLPRRALAQAIDRQALCDKVLHGYCQAAAGILPPGILGHDPLMPTLSYDPEAAAALLAEAGHADGRGLPELELWVQERAEHEAVAYAIVEQLARIGLRVSVHPVPWTELLAAAANGGYDLLLIPWVADYPDPDNFLFPLLHGSQCDAKNYACYRNPLFDRLIEEARRARASSERLALYRRAEQLAIDDSPFVPLYYPTDAVVIRRGWSELVLHPTGWQEIPLEHLRWRGE
jgi:peptide/nickel transport system substrate-binding protein/oligopeptide transport system substrate-binding protein